MYVDLGEPSGAKLRIHGLMYDEFRRVVSAAQATADAAGEGCGPMPSAETGTAGEWHRYLRDSGLALEDVLGLLPARFGVNIQVLDNSLSWSGTNSTIGSARHDTNAYIDAILKTIYKDSAKHMRRGSASQDTARSPAEPAGGQQDRAGGQRNTIFCSYSPTVCVALNWKQPNYAVFLLTTGREPLDPEASLSARSVARAAGAPSFGPPTNHLSLKEAVRFACTNNLLGIMCSASLLTRVPALVDSIKGNGLVAISFGPENRDEQLCAAQKDRGVDAIMCDGAIMYEPDQSLEYAI
ncbi:phosphate system positive regulatory protein pho81 [Coemansia spiralis]|nr:phosphate system positive regulatory protein pho81 [Coemansia spiralis]